MNKDKEKLLKAEKVCVCMHAHVHTLSCVQLFAIPWTVACQTPLSKRFPRQEYWSGLPFPSPVTFRLKLFRVLLNFSLLMTIDPKDSTRPKNRKRKDLLLAESKKNTRDLSQNNVSQ